MAFTAQQEIDALRITLAEVDPLNSRWKDVRDLLFYVNRGRRRFAEESKAIKRIFEQTTVVGPTTLGQGRVARFALDPLVYEIDVIFYDEIEVHRSSKNAWNDQVSGRAWLVEGTPFIYRRIGDTFDLFFAPSEIKILEVHASTWPVDLANIVALEADLNDHQVPVALDFAAWEALEDDDRDATIYERRATAGARRFRKVVEKPGPRYTQQGYSDPASSFT